MRVLRRVALGVVVLLVIWLVVGSLLIVRPHTVRPSRADAIMVLGPSLDPRLHLAVRLAGRLHVGDLAISIGDTPGQGRGGLCSQPPPGVRVTCFRPDPYTTRGEARELGALAAARGWHDVIVIGPTPQLSRARLLAGRCFGGTLQMVASPEHLGIAGWVDQFVYQSAAFGKAVVESVC